MKTEAWIPLKSIYIRQGINIAGHQNRIYDASPTWELHLHPQGTLVSLLYTPENSLHLISTTQIECMQTLQGTELDTSQVASREALSNFPATRAPSGQVTDSNGLVANQVRHQIQPEPVFAVSGAEVLGEEPQKKVPAQNPVNEREILAKAEHLAPVDSAPAKKKRGRPRKVVASQASSGASF